MVLAVMSMADNDYYEQIHSRLPEACGFEMTTGEQL
jgi:hypothetical protein